jgi:hypothetical protein
MEQMSSDMEQQNQQQRKSAQQNMDATTNVTKAAAISYTTRVAKESIVWLA